MQTNLRKDKDRTERITHMQHVTSTPGVAGHVSSCLLTRRFDGQRVRNSIAARLYIRRPPSPSTSTSPLLRFCAAFKVLWRRKKRPAMIPRARWLSWACKVVGSNRLLSCKYSLNWLTHPRPGPISCSVQSRRTAGQIPIAISIDSMR